MEKNTVYYARRAQQEVDAAASATDPAVKKIHLNLASKYATLRERSAAAV
jgi:hypothetical protein